MSADGSQKPYKRSAGTRGKAKDREELARLKGLLAQCHKDDFMQAAYLYGLICDIVGLTSPSGAAPYPRACRVCGWYGHNRLKCPRYASQQAAAAANEKSKCEYTSPLNGGPELYAGHRDWCLEVRAIEERNKEGVRRGIGAAHTSNCDCKACREWDEWMAPVRKEKPRFYRLSDPGPTPMGARLLQCEQMPDGVPEERARWLVELWERTHRVLDPQLGAGHVGITHLAVGGASESLDAGDGTLNLLDGERLRAVDVEEFKQ